MLPITKSLLLVEVAVLAAILHRHTRPDAPSKLEEARFDS